MKTFIFIRNKKYRPSSYYRIVQYLKDMTSKQIELCEYETNFFYEKKANGKFLKLLYTLIFSLIPGYFRRLYAINKILREKNNYNIFIQRECFPRIIGPIGRVLLKKILGNATNVYWDFDDNIFESKEISKCEETLLCEYSNKIFVGNQYLRGKLDLPDMEKVFVINTTDTMMENIDLDKINIHRKEKLEEEVTLIWIGTKFNLKHLENIISELDAAASKMTSKRMVLKVISDGLIKNQTKHLIIKNIKWERSLALQEMLDAHIGLMPLNDNEFTKGKCAFKAVQAIGCGLPVIVSDVGMNKEVVEKGNGILIQNNHDWSEAVLKLVSSTVEWEGKSKLSRNLWCENYNSEKIRNKILNII